MRSILDKLFDAVVFVGVNDVGNESFPWENIAYFQFEVMGNPFGKLFENIQRDAIDINSIGDVSQPWTSLNADLLPR